MRRAEAARYLGVSETTLRRIVAKGLLPIIRVSDRLVAFDQADLDRYKQERKQWVSDPIKTNKAASVIGSRSRGAADDWLINAYLREPRAKKLRHTTPASSANGSTATVLEFRKSR